jgi:hypothetical protein
VVKPLRSSSQQNVGGEAKSPSTSGPAAAGTSSAAKHPSLGHQRPGPADYLELLALTVLKFIQGALACTLAPPSRLCRPTSNPSTVRAL